MADPPVSVSLTHAWQSLSSSLMKPFFIFHHIYNRFRGPIQCWINRDTIGQIIITQIPSVRFKFYFNRPGIARFFAEEHDHRFAVFFFYHHRYLPPPLPALLKTLRQSAYKGGSFH